MTQAANGPPRATVWTPLVENDNHVIQIVWFSQINDKDFLFPPQINFSCSRGFFLWHFSWKVHLHQYDHSGSKVEQNGHRSAVLKCFRYTLSLFSHFLWIFFSFSGQRFVCMSRKWLSCPSFCWPSSWSRWSSSCCCASVQKRSSASVSAPWSPLTGGSCMASTVRSSRLLGGPTAI